MKSSMARSLVEGFSSPGDTVLDPFCGSGAIPLEASIAKRNVVCSDVNPYAVTLTRSKLKAPANLHLALGRAERALSSASDKSNRASLTQAPLWVQSFFHPETLRESLQFLKVVQQKGDFFLLACMLGILHHERPGFLSFPSSHLVPYLRSRKFPREDFPQMYEYRHLEYRLTAKISRTFRRPATIDQSLQRVCRQTDFRNLDLKRNSVDSIITSPPYMDTLDYARDNRLRLWFLGVKDYRSLNLRLGSKDEFCRLMTDLLLRARRWLQRRSRCVLVLGDLSSRKRSFATQSIVSDLATKVVGGFRVESIIRDEIPDIRRSRREVSATETELIIVLRKK